MSWTKVTNGQIPPNALVAGYEADGTALYVARAEHEGGQHPGKTSKPLGAIHFGWGGKEETKSDYEVLCCNPRQLACVRRVVCACACRVMSCVMWLTERKRTRTRCRCTG